MRAELRALNRGSLLIIAERAIELLPAAQLNTLLSDFVRLTTRPSEAGDAPVSLPDEVREFYVQKHAQASSSSLGCSATSTKATMTYCFFDDGS